jgi:hypothetical protein
MSQSQKMSRLTKDLGRATELRNDATEAMRAATKSMLTTCATVRGELGHEYATHTHKFLASLTKDVAAYRRAMSHQIAKTKKNVAADHQAMVSNIARWMGARSKASKQLHHDLQREATSVMNKTAELRSRISDAHERMAKQQRANLKSGHQKLRTGTARFVNAMHADRMKAHAIWSNFRAGSAA